jgi:hypothetical protein
MSSRFRHEDVAAVPTGWKVRTVKAGSHRVRVAFPPGRKQKGSGRLVSVLHPLVGSNPCANPCSLRASNPAELMVMSANHPPRRRRSKLEMQRDTRDRAATIRHARNPMTARAWNKMDSETRYKILRAIYQDSQMVNHMAISKWKQIPKAARDVISRNPAELLIMGANPAGETTVRRMVEIYQGFRASGSSHNDAISKTLAQFYANTEDRQEFERRVSRGGFGLNPRVEVVHGDNPPVEDITEEFTGTEVKWLDVYNEPHIPRGRYAYLAKLLSLHIKPAKGGQVQRITFGEGESAPLIVSDSSAKQIYFVGGNQDISSTFRSFLDQDPSQVVINEGLRVVTLGQGRRIDYQGRKEHVADPDEDKWKHDHGEENGVLPTVLFDTRNKRLLYEGGDYRIDGPWIRN